MHVPAILKKYNFKPNDLMGQNFLVNDKVLEKIAAAAQIKNTDQVLEIGSGIGNLTSMLAEQAGYVLAVEKDKRYFTIIKDQLGARLRRHGRISEPQKQLEPSGQSRSQGQSQPQDQNVELVFADIMRFNFQQFLDPGYKVVANIPYYASGRIIQILLGAHKKASKIILMLQKEVAERIIANVGHLNLLAISVRVYADAEIVAYVPKEDFFPRPKVDSAILKIDLLPKPRLKFAGASCEKLFFRIIRAAFAGKRKQLHNSLKHNLKLPAGILDQAFAMKILDPKSRAQQISLEQWQKFLNFLQKKAGCDII